MNQDNFCKKFPTIIKKHISSISLNNSAKCNFQQVSSEITQIQEIFGRLTLVHKIGQVKVFIHPNIFVNSLYGLFKGLFYKNKIELWGVHMIQITIMKSIVYFLLLYFIGRTIYHKMVIIVFFYINRKDWYKYFSVNAEELMGNTEYNMLIIKVFLLRSS